jgi:hypothetical protein
MSSGYSSVQGGFRVNTAPVMVGAVLVSVGILLGMAGVLVGGREVFAATRRWLRELEVPPGEVARHRWDQTKAAAAAGARAWQHHDGAPARHGHS